MRSIFAHALMTCLITLLTGHIVAAEVKWEDVLADDGSPRTLWANQTVRQKAEYLELYSGSIKYCLANLGKNIEEADSSIIGPRVIPFRKITFENISMLYREYGDLRKAAYYQRRFFEASTADSNMPVMFAEENILGNVLIAYEAAGLYKEALPYYEKRYQERVQMMKDFSNVNLLKTDFAEYKKQYPDLAESYSSFMNAWKKAKKLSKTEKPRPLDPAVQSHEWFYGDKQDEVLKSLDYYYSGKVNFMLEKALKHKDPIVAAKAKEYLESLNKSEPNSSGRGRL